jgi:P2-related tail formation protein
MREIITSIFQDCSISEWWQTGELPYTFRVLISSDPGEAGIAAIQEAVLALKPESRGYLGIVIQGVSSQTVWVGATTMHVGESYVIAKPPGFPPLWTPAMGILKQT